MGTTNVFVLETELVQELEKHLSHCPNVFTILSLAYEFNYSAGKVDVIANNDEGELVVFEAKLKKWREALYQAYRNSSFAHYSYVVLPEKTCECALKCVHEFDRRGVGLCSCSPSGLKIEIQAPKNDPIMPWLTNAALNLIRSKRDG